MTAPDRPDLDALAEAYLKALRLDNTNALHLREVSMLSNFGMLELGTRHFTLNHERIYRLLSYARELEGRVKELEALLERFCYDWDENMNNVDCGPSYDLRQEARQALKGGSHE